MDVSKICINELATQNHGQISLAAKVVKKGKQNQREKK